MNTEYIEQTNQLKVTLGTTIHTYGLSPWVGRRSDSWGNNRACDCKDLMRVEGYFCVCLGRCWCPTHGGPRCVGGHD